MTHCRKKGNRWYYRVTWTDEEGTHHVERAGGKTKTECLQAWREAMVEIQRRGELRKTASLQFGDALDEWLEKEVSINSKESTYDTYSSIIRNHLPNTIQSIPLKKITTSVLQDH